MKKKNIRYFFIGLISGIIIWFIIDLIWDWEGNVKSFQEGYNAAQKRFSEVLK